MKIHPVGFLLKSNWLKKKVFYLGLTFYMPPLVLQHGKSILLHSSPVHKKERSTHSQKKPQNTSHLPVLGSTSAGKCGGGFPGVKCSLLYVISGVRGCTWCGCCTTGTLLDCQEKKVDTVRAVLGIPPLQHEVWHTKIWVARISEWSSDFSRFLLGVTLAVFPPSCLKPPQHTLSAVEVL